MKLEHILRRFDRKERNWLIRDALGSNAKDLRPAFRERIEKQVRKRDADFSFGDDYYWGIDYHIDWLVAALYMIKHDKESVEEAENRSPRGERIIAGNQQDIDLVVGTRNTLILIEAKGVGTWGAQIGQKLQRLDTLCGLVDEDGRCGEVTLHFLLCAPTKKPIVPAHRFRSQWMHPDGEFLFFALEPAYRDLFAVQRCEGGKGNATGKHWRTIRTKLETPLVPS